MAQIQDEEEVVPADDQATQTLDEQQVVEEQPAADEAVTQVADENTAQPAEEAAQVQEEAAATEQPAAAVEEAPAAEAAAAEAPAAEEAPAQELVEEKPAPKPAKKAVKKAPPAKKKVAMKAKKAAPKPVEEPPVQEETPAADDAQVQAQAELDATAQAEAEAQAQAEAEAQAQAQAEAEAEAEAQPAAKAGKKVVDTPDVNQAAAVAQAAAQLFPEEKAWSKMSAGEKAAKKAKDQKAAALEKQRKKEKEERENPTVDENGEHIQTVAEAKEEAKQLQEMLDAGTAAVEQKIQMEQEQMANEPAVPAEPVKQEEDDGHLETVEEVKAKMALAQKQMNEGLANTEKKVQQMSDENASMPDFGALGNLYGSISNMGKSRKKKQMTDLAQKLGVEVAEGDLDLSAEDLTNTMIERAKAGGKTQEEITAAMEE